MRAFLLGRPLGSSSIKEKNPLTVALFLSVFKGIGNTESFFRDTNIRNKRFLKCSSAQETPNFKQFRAIINHRIRNERIMMSFALSRIKKYIALAP